MSKTAEEILSNSLSETLNDNLWRDVVEAMEEYANQQLAEKDKHYYRCNKCGQSVSDLKGVSCHQPMEVRTSGMCGGSCTVEMTVTEYYDQIIEWKDKKLAGVLEKIRTVRPKKKNGEFHEGMEHAVDRILELLNQNHE